MNALRKYGTIPIGTDVLKEHLKGYKSPRNKMLAMNRKGEIERLKRGLYINVQDELISKELIANHLYGPSYVSMEWALAFYGLIPERVFTLRSMTIKRSRTFNTFLGVFDFVTCPISYFSIGIQQKEGLNNYVFLIATPEKAICDIVFATPNLKIQSVKALKIYLSENLRMDMSILKTLNKDIIGECMVVGKKKEQLKLLYKLIENECI